MESFKLVDPQIVETSWHKDRDRLLEIRTVVFVEEQQVPVEIEIDELDPNATHFLALSKNCAIGTARAIIDGSDIARIGRVAVLKPYRGMGVGNHLMQHAEHWIKQHSAAKNIEIHAQVHSLGFYETLGYIANSNIYLEAGIEHITMRKQI